MDKLNFAERLKSARIKNGLSLQELSDKLENKITKQGLHRYEQGEAMPNSEMLGILCDVLNVRPDYFSRKSTIKLAEIVHYRKFDKLPLKEQHKILGEVIENIERYTDLEDIISINDNFKNPLKNNKVSNKEDIENIAKELREIWNLDEKPITNTLELLENNNVKVIEVMVDDDFDGLQSWVNGKQFPVIVLNKGKLKSNDRKRFTALHELAHLIIDFGELEEKDQEKLCNAFAGAMLLPANQIRKELGEKRSKVTIQELGIIKEQFGISIQAIVYRLSDLGIISKNYTSYLFMHIKQMGWKEVEPYEYTGKEKSSRFDRLLFRALSEEKISMSKAASLKNMKVSEFRKSLMIAE